MDIFVVDGRTYNVHVVDIVETVNILYSENTGRTVNGDMVLDPIGTFIGHKITVARRNGQENEYDDLFDYLLIPRFDGITVKVVHGQTSIEYAAYVSTEERPVQRIDEANNRVYWGELSLNIVPISAQVRPE